MLNRPYDRNYNGAALMGEPEAWTTAPRHEPHRDVRPEPRTAPWRQTYVEERLSAAEYRAAPPRPAYATPRYAQRAGDPATYGDFHELARAIEERRYRTRPPEPSYGAPRQVAPALPPRHAPAPQPREWAGRPQRFEAEPLSGRPAPAPERPRPYYERAPQAEPVPARRAPTYIENVRAEPGIAEGPARAPVQAAPVRQDRSTHDAQIIEALQLTIQALEARIARLEARPLSRFEKAREKAEATTACIAAALPPEPQSRSARLREAARVKTEEAQAARAEGEAAPMREPSPRRLWA